MQAFHNSAAIAMCNRVGCEGEMVFSGESIVVDANGQVLARAGDAEELLYADVDMAASRRIPGEQAVTPGLPADGNSTSERAIRVGGGRADRAGTGRRPRQGSAKSLSGKLTALLQFGTFPLGRFVL